jgi:hypothetical protein
MTSRVQAAQKVAISGADKLDRLQNKYTNCKGDKNNSNFGQITGIQEKLDTTCKQNAS